MMDPRESELYRGAIRVRINRQIAFALLGVAFLGALAILLRARTQFDQDMARLDSSESSIEAPATSGNNIAWIEFDFNPVRKRKFEGDFSGFSSYPLLLALQDVAQAGDFTFRVRAGKVEEIAHVGANEKGAWRIYRNNQVQLASISQLAIQRGDVYTFRFED